MKKIGLITLIILFSYNVKAQDCKAYIPYEKGTTTELTNYDKKGKALSVTSQQLTNVVEEGSATTFTLHQIFEDLDKDNDRIETDVTYKCIDGDFFIDMGGYFDQSQMEAYKDMEVKVSMDEIDIPSSYKVGQKLKDGSVKMEVIGAPMPINMTVNIINRLVAAEEERTTPAGSFRCVKITQDIETKAFMKMTLSSIEWHAEGVGLVRSETYKKGKLIAYSELTKIDKP